MRALWVTLLLAAACQGRTASEEGWKDSFVVRRGPLEDSFMITGELEATKAEVLRVPKTPTYVIAIKWIVEDGAMVKKGDKVVEFDTTSLSGTLADKRLAVQRAETEVASENARTATADAALQVEVVRRRTALEKARLEASVPEDLRTKREHQERQLAVQNEADALAKAEDDLAAQQRAGRIDRRIKEIALSRVRRDLIEVENRLDQLALRAPRDGMVQISVNQRDGLRKFMIGDMAYSGMDVGTVPDLSGMRVKARLFDVDEGAIKVGMTARCFLDAHAGKLLTGTVASISPIARAEGRDAVRRIFDVIVKLDQTEPEVMLPGMSVRVEVVRRKLDAALLVPRAALTMTDGKTFVRLADGRHQPVELEFCALHECVIRKGPLEGTALAGPAVAKRKPS